MTYPSSPSRESNIGAPSSRGAAPTRRVKGFGEFVSFYEDCEKLGKIVKVVFGRLYDDPYTYRVDVDVEEPKFGVITYDRIIRQVPEGLKQKIIRQMYRENDGHVVAEKTYEYFSELEDAIEEFLSKEGFEYEDYDAREGLAETWTRGEA